MTRETRENSFLDNIENEDRNRIHLTREDDRISHEVDTRKRSSIYDLPDYDKIDGPEGDRVLQLISPPARIHPKWGKMRQFWANKNMNNGRRVQDLLRTGYAVRDPKTIEKGFHWATEQWQGEDVIMVADTHILMEIPEFFYRKIEKKRTEHNNSIINGIKQTHGQVMVDGEIHQQKLPEAGTFMKEFTVQREESNGGRDINFAD